MHSFLLRVLSFFCLFILVSVFLFILKSNSKEWWKINGYEPQIDGIFLQKKENFDQFIIDNKSINLVLGSSHIEDGIIPDSLGKNWFSFSTGGQTIYNSYKFLDYYKDKIKIDTVIVGVEPFDFPESYLKEIRTGFNPNFILFGEDSLTNLFYKDFKKRTFRNIKNSIYPNINYFIDILKETEIGDTKKERFISNQGFSGRIDLIGINLDLLYKSNPDMSEFHVKHFYNVNKKPNFDYFDLFSSICKSNNITVFYLLSPKSEYYFKNLEKTDNNILWESIIKELVRRNVSIWDFQHRLKDKSDNNIFTDETHLSYEGAKIFTASLKKELIKNKK